MKDTTFIRRIRLRNYKSIGFCDVGLGPLVFLVGPNGVGKSNFLDALRFVAESLRTTLDHAFRERGGIKEVRRRSAGHPTHFSIRLELTLPSGATGDYEFRVGARPQGGYEVQHEECRLASAEALGGDAHFVVRSGQVVATSIRSPPAAASDRLYLVNVSGFKEFRPAYDALSKMGFYNLNPMEIRDLQPPDPGDLLLRDGRNVGSVLAKLSPEAKRRIEEYLESVVPGVHGVDAKTISSKETLEFRQTVAGSKDPWRFLASSMSDGTLRVLGILVALFQGANGEDRRVPLVGIEEPEVALHPGAAGVLLDGLRDASRSTQVLVTSHSPDLLDDEKITADCLLAVSNEGGTTVVAPLDDAGRGALKDRLYTAGELLRMNQLVPDPGAAAAFAGQNQSESYKEEKPRE